MVKALANPNTQRRFVDLGFIAVGDTAQEFIAQVNVHVEAPRPIVREIPAQN